MKKPVDERVPLLASCGLNLRALALVLSLHAAALAWATLVMSSDKVEQIAVMSVQLLPMAPPVATPHKQEPPKPLPVPKPKTPEPVVTRVKTAEAVKAAPLPEPRPVAETPKPEARQPEPQPEPVMQAPVYQIGSVNNPAPEYPNRSRDLHEQGRVVLRVLVGVDGRARQVEIGQSSGFPRLDEAARFIVARKWKFTPARRGDEVIETWCRVGFNFELNDAD